MMRLSYCLHLCDVLNAADISCINLYLERQSKMGIPILDRHHAIRASNGLTSFSRIDIYVAPNRMIFLSSVDESNGSPIGFDLDIT